MYLYSYRKRPNFGDALNDYLWPRFIRTPLEAEPGSNEVFVGIGTLLNERLPASGVLHIFGSGLGYGTVPAEAVARWTVHFVRGPLTAASLNLDPKLAISDPGILLHRTEDLNPKKDIDCAFMPHHALFSERMRQLCEQAGVHFIHPEASCDSVIDQIGRSRKLICSAMHGAITAEALRVPWLPVITNRQMLLSKWHDWSASMQTEVHFHKLPTIWSHANRSPHGWVLAKFKGNAFSRKLKQLARKGNFQLGADRILQDRIQRIENKIHDFNSQICSQVDGADQPQKGASQLKADWAK
ncbi:polysaccharide pyruvyl transferase family protein [Thioalkalivibrio sp. ALMg9]|uniref:polysaccharide pyruvyl transferase family protein n=1 Tax=Thioalkalivibrio sp. ALMg9 TaxID=1266912 RepID=UPI00036C2A50|nr:polysaccharide pyruvyl transferase family protein [Thioalkalivibrio sp. ALMg9]